MEPSDSQKLLTQGVALVKAIHGKGPLPPNVPPDSSPEDLRKEARKILLRVTDLDDQDIRVWLWLSAVAEDNTERYICYQNILSLDPHNKAALNGLERLYREVENSPAEAALAKPVKPPGTHDDPHPTHYKRLKPAPASTTRPDTAGAGQDRCPFCRRPVGTLDTTCPHCTLPLMVPCPACNTLMDVEWTRCTECNHNLGDYRRGAAYFIELADQYQQYHRLAHADQFLQYADTLEPDRPDVQRRLSEVQAGRGKPEEAIATLKAAIEAEPDNGNLYISLGNVYRQSRHYSQAAQSYLDALARAPKSAEAYFALGDLYLERDKIKEAREPLQKATRLNPQDGHAWARLAETYDALQQYRPAVKAYQQAERHLSPELVLYKQVRERLNQLNPRLPAELLQGWPEFLRQVSGPILVFLIALLLDSGLRPWWIHWSGWLVLLPALLGTLLWVSSTTLPQNPIIRSAAGAEGLAEFKGRPVIAALGLLLWFAAFVVVLYPINQSPSEWPN
ncbi:MAG: tetratricopeptide repeat protein [Anaerolineae bacterium]|nr:tetratricopeptide repeat protein [Anaerolineae bacterium]